MFAFEGQIFTCFGYGRNVAIYKDVSLFDSVTLTDEEDNEVIGLAFDQETLKLSVLSRADNKIVLSHIDLGSQKFSIVDKVVIGDGLKEYSNILQSKGNWILEGTQGKS